MKFILSFIVDNLLTSTCYTQLATGCATSHIGLSGAQWIGASTRSGCLGEEWRNKREAVVWVGLAGTRLLSLAKPKPPQMKSLRITALTCRRRHITPVLSDNVLSQTQFVGTVTGRDPLIYDKSMIPPELCAIVVPASGNKLTNTHYV